MSIETFKTIINLTPYLCLAWILSCKSQIKNIDQDTSIPTFVEADKKYADVYKPLDGTWKGEFIIYEDPNPKPKSEVELTNLSLAQVTAPHLKVVNTIKVQQIYKSESPYYQTVDIIDFYPETNKKEMSSGANKVQDGKMWCVVNKPNDKIVHLGSTRGSNTIIWQQNQTSPTKVEFFQETVDEKFYEIIGYGYYDGDDLSLSPRLWFYGKYEKS